MSLNRGENVMLLNCLFESVLEQFEPTVPQFSHFAYFPHIKCLKRTLRWPSYTPGVTLQNAFVIFHSCGRATLLWGYHVTSTGGGAGDPKFTKIPAYRKCLCIYAMILHSAFDLDNEGSKRVIPCNDMLFGGLNDVPLIFPYWLKTFVQDLVQRCNTTKFDQKGNRKLIRLTSSVECREHMCVVLSDYTRYLNQIW